MDTHRASYQTTGDLFVVATSGREVCTVRRMFGESDEDLRRRADEVARALSAAPWPRDDGVLIALCPVTEADGMTLASDVVLRDLGDKYAVHRQNRADGSHHGGQYFHKDRGDALQRAWAAFGERVAAYACAHGAAR